MCDSSAPHRERCRRRQRLRSDFWESAHFLCPGAGRLRGSRPSDSPRRHPEVCRFSMGGAALRLWPPCEVSVFLPITRPKPSDLYQKRAVFLTARPRRRYQHLNPPAQHPHQPQTRLNFSPAPLFPFLYMYMYRAHTATSTRKSQPPGVSRRHVRENSCFSRSALLSSILPAWTRDFGQQKCGYIL